MWSLVFFLSFNKTINEKQFLLSLPKDWIPDHLSVTKGPQSTHLSRSSVLLSPSRDRDSLSFITTLLQKFSPSSQRASPWRNSEGKEKAPRPSKEKEPSYIGREWLLQSELLQQERKRPPKNTHRPFARVSPLTADNISKKKNWYSNF